MTKSTKLEVRFEPSPYDLSEIKGWLYEELRLTGKGYKNNWQIIFSAYKRHSMAVLSEAENTVGFAIWYELDFHIRLDIFCIDMPRRRQGLGNYFISELSQYFITKGKFAIELQCSPPESEVYWRKHGFDNLSYQQSLGIGHNRWLYRPLFKSAKLSILQNIGKFILLWDQDPSTVQQINEDAKWVWQIELKEETNELLKPVIFPCRQDWQIQYIIDGTIQETKKVKYFNNQTSYSDNMLVIHSVEEVL
jgi:hypothetical protein